MAGVLEIMLERDGHDQPWGFRLQGGHDVGMPLSIQRVLVGTPSEGVLKRGDILLRVSKTDARSLTHQQAADLFTNTGNQIGIQIKRTGLQSQISLNANSSVAPPKPVPVKGGVALPHLSPLSPGITNKHLSTLPNSPGLCQAAYQKSSTAPISLTVQNQPYRTAPLIQPSVKVDQGPLGPGSVQHLKQQSDYVIGYKEPQNYVMNSRSNDFNMKQKVRGVQITLRGSEMKSRGLELGSSRFSRFSSHSPILKDMMRSSTARNFKLADFENGKSKTLKFDVSLLKKKSYMDMEVDDNNNPFMFGGEKVMLRKTPSRPKRPVEPVVIEEISLKKVDPKLLIKKKPKPLQVPKEYQDEQIPEYDKTELKELNFKVEKTVLEKCEKKKTTKKKVKREKYVKEQLKQYKKDPPKEKKKRVLAEPVVKKTWNKEKKVEAKKEAVKIPVFKTKARSNIQTKPKRYIKFEVRTSRKEEYSDEITLLDPKDELLKFKGRGDQTATFTIKLQPPTVNGYNDFEDDYDCDSIDVYSTIKI